MAVSLVMRLSKNTLHSCHKFLIKRQKVVVEKTLHICMFSSLYICILISACWILIFLDHTSIFDTKKSKQVFNYQLSPYQFFGAIKISE